MYTILGFLKNWVHVKLLLLLHITDVTFSNTGLFHLWMVTSILDVTDVFVKIFLDRTTQFYYHPFRFCCNLLSLHTFVHSIHCTYFFASFFILNKQQFHNFGCVRKVNDVSLSLLTPLRCLKQGFYHHIIVAHIP